MNRQVPAVVDELLPLVRQFATVDYDIALGGAHAKGTADPASDLDLYVFSQTIPSGARREQLVTDFSAGVDGVCVVECRLRSRQHVDATIAECVAGTVRRDLVTWTTTGFFNHCALSDLQMMVPLDDPVGMLADWKQRIQVDPSRLRRTILREHLPAAAFWPHNFHFNSAVERADVIYTTGIAQPGRSVASPAPDSGWVRRQDAGPAGASP